MLHGQLVRLRPATASDRRPVFEWLTASDVTASMMGPPLYPDMPVPTWDEFCADFRPHFFDGSRAQRARSFIIEVDGAAIGQTNYDGLDPQERRTELDIWLRASRYCGKGYGSDAVDVLVRHLAGEYGVREFVLRPSRRNPRAIRAYQRAGFVEVAMPPEERTRRYGQGDCADDVLLVRIEERAAAGNGG